MCKNCRQGPNQILTANEPKRSVHIRVTQVLLKFARPAVSGVIEIATTNVFDYLVHCNLTTQPVPYL
jgi:hypothetical protein